MPKAKSQIEQSAEIAAALFAHNSQNPIKSLERTEAEVYEFVAGEMPFQKEFREPIKEAFEAIEETANNAIQNALEGKDPSEALEALNGLGIAHKQAVNDYAAAIGGHYPSLKASMEALQVQDAPESPTVVKDALDYVKSLNEWFYKAFDESEIKIVGYRKKHAREDVETAKSERFPVNTSAPLVAIKRAAADGKHNANFTDGEYQKGNEALKIITHHRKGEKFKVEIQQETEGDNLGSVIEGLDADSAKILDYVINLLFKDFDWETGTSLNTHLKVDLNDVSYMTMSQPETAQEAEENRQKVYRTLQYAARAFIRGERYSEYKNKVTGEKMDTKIQSRLLYIDRLEYPAEWTPGYFAGIAPVRVGVGLTAEWKEHLIANPDMWERLEGGEILAAIPSKQSGGDLARCLGEAFLHFARLNAKDPTKRPTRSELLRYMTPKNLEATEAEFLKRPNPIRFAKVFEGVEAWLIEKGVIKIPEKRSVMTVKSISAGDLVSRKGWKRPWLDETLDWVLVGDSGRHLDEIKAKIPTSKSRNLKAKRRKPTKRAKKEV